MKIRAGFVSNSSSSSYVIAIDPSMSLEDLQERFPDRQCSGEYTEVDAFGVEEVYDRLCNWDILDYYRDEKEWDYCRQVLTGLLGYAATISRVAEEGKNIAMVRVPYYDKEGYDALEDFEIIYDWS